MSLLNNDNQVSSSVIAASMLIVTIYFITYLWKRRWLYYHGSKMFGPFAWPIIGNTLQFVGGLDEMFETFTNHFKIYKPIYRFWLGNRLFIFPIKPEYIEIVLNKTLEKEKFYEVLKPALGNGLVTAPFAIWKKTRKVINPTLNKQILNSFIDKLVIQGNILIQKLQKQSGNFDIIPLLYRCNMDQISETVLDYHMNAQKEDNEYATSIARGTEIVHSRGFKIWQQPEVLWKLNPLSKELDKLLTKNKVLIKKIIQNYRDNNWSGKHLENHHFEDNQMQRNFMNCLELEVVRKNFKEDQLYDEVITMLFAGSGTSASADGFVLIMIGMHPKVQAKVYEEQREIFGDDPGKVTAADLSEMKYLERVIKETLRIFPTVPFFLRQVYEDINLGDFVMPKGSSCGISPFAIHRDEEYWPEPLKFDPDRFLPEEMTKRHPYSYIPFGGGPRNCIGLNYAMRSVKILLSMIVRQFTITTEYKTVADIKLSAEIVLKCANGFNVAMKSRK